METKLIIDLAQQTLHVEGNEEFVREIYRDFKDRMGKPSPIVTKKVNREQGMTNEGQIPAKPKTKQPKKETFSIVKGLDLAAKGDEPSLKDFFSQYSPKNNFERNLIFVYYLQNIRKVEPINTDHIFTCYRHVGIKIPGAFRQSLWDTASDRGWIDTSSLDNITITTQGINYIEHDITKAG